MHIDSSEISVIIQGPVIHSSYQFTEKSLTESTIDSIRTLLPHSEIILSTWNSDRLDTSKIDQVIISKDPGAQKFNPEGITNNINRQIVSTVAGLKAATRKYSLKIRSDIVLNSINFLNYFGETQTHKSSFQIFKEKIISNNLTSRNPNQYAAAGFGFKLLFHISDHVHFGLTEDLLLLWDIPLQSDEEAAYFQKRVYPEPFKTNESARYAPEQFLATSCFRKKFQIPFDDYASWSPDLEILSENLLLNNFIFVKDKDFSINFPKYHTRYESYFEPIRYHQQNTSVSPTADVYPLLNKIEQAALAKTKPLVSIIMPVYNSWPCLEVCVESITSQDYSNIEIILVNDHSTQPELTDYFSQITKIDSRVKVITATKKGANLARKDGIELAQGQYILMVDSDDILSQDAISRLVSTAENAHADVVVFGFEEFNHTDGKTTASYLPKISTQLANYRSDFARNIVQITATYNHTFWLYFFKKDKFDTQNLALGLKYYEELPALAQLHNSHHIFAFVCAPLYKYRVGIPGQLTASWGNSNRDQKLHDLNKAIEIAYSKYTEDKASRHFLIKKAAQIILAEIQISEKSDAFNQENLYQYLSNTAKCFKFKDLIKLRKTLGMRWVVFLTLVGKTNRKTISRLIQANIKFTQTTLHCKSAIKAILS